MSDKEILKKAITKVREARDIPALPNYKVTKDGEVYSKYRSKWMSKHTDRKGYYYFSLWIDGRTKLMKAHRLVALAFIPNPDEKPFIHHKDGNRKNNNISNLEWVTPSENVLGGFKNGRKAWNKDIKSVKNMTLMNLARELPRLQEEAKAFWGEKYPVVRLTAEIESMKGGEKGFVRELSSYKFHLLNMVLEEEPLKYIEKFL